MARFLNSSTPLFSAAATNALHKFRKAGGKIRFASDTHLLNIAAYDFD